MKTLKENATEKERSDLISELQVMKMLDSHPNIVKLLGCCTEKDPIFLIMEFVSKGKLQSYLRNSRAERYYNNVHGQSKTLTSRDLTSFVYQVARGMEFLSENGVRYFISLLSCIINYVRVFVRGSTLQKLLLKFLRFFLMLQNKDKKME